MRAELRNYAAVVRGARQYLQSRPLPDPAAAVRERFERRAADFLATARRVIFGNPANPYGALFRAAGCTFDDLAESVSRKGLEETLRVLHREGVYLTHEEFKGRTPIVRRGLEVLASTDAFANSAVTPLMQTTTSGSTGRPVRLIKGLERTLYTEAYHALVAREHGLEGGAFLELKAMLPGSTGLYAVLRRARQRRSVAAWFCAGGSWREAAHHRLATHAVILMARAMGYRAPFPSFLPPGDFTPAARWLAGRRREGRPCWVSGMTSAVTRLAASALDAGLDVSGTKAEVGGEPLTDAKRAVLARAGIHPVNGYFISEIGAIGYACRHMVDGNRVHHFSENTAVISHRRRAPHSDVEIDSLLFTTLQPFAPLFLVNVEMEDAGTIAPAGCDCTFSRTGWTTAIGDVFSFGKLTGQGMTLIGSDMIDLLERTLPQRFGGHPGDFQLVEREGPSQTELDLLVSPRLAGASPELVRDVFYAEVRRRTYGLQAERIWRQSDAVRVVVAEPLATETGKVPPLRLLGAAGEVRHAS